MGSTMYERISESRRKLRNPYAYLDGEGSYSAADANESADNSTDQQLAESRALLQDPYAYLDGEGKFTALMTRPKAVKHSRRISQQAVPRQHSSPIAKKALRHSNSEIEQAAKELHKKIWQDRDQIWRGNPPSDPIAMLDPSVALGLIGYDYEIAETLGQYPGGIIEVAGMVDSTSKRVSISRQFPANVRTFTAAHEVGHAVLHGARGVHRDRALDGTALSRDAVEFEADKFASYFLMPEKLVRSRFVSTFGSELFTVSEATAFALGRTNLSDFQRQYKTLRDLSRLLARAERYNGQQICSLANQFRVSIEAMAIRLEELGLLGI